MDVPLAEDKMMKKYALITEDKTMDSKYVVVFYDNETEDYTIIGPFDTEDKANEWVAGYKVPVTVWVTTLIGPEEID